MLEQFSNIEIRLKALEQHVSSLGKNKTYLDLPAQAETLYGIRLALCVDTHDPLSQGRVRFYSPALHNKNTPIKALPYARPVANLGGFDDSGGTWVPPAGSTLVLMFENGDRDAPYYIGTTWTRDRGPGGQNWDYPMQEFEKYHQGHRGGYTIGAQDESQVFPPWNSESNNIKDYDSITDFDQDTNAHKKITIPHIAGLKTPQKHRIKMDDGNYDCNFRWKRMEMVSGDGVGMLFKDDHLHPSGQWLHPSCGCENSGTLEDCVDDDGNPTEKTDCGAAHNTSECANEFAKRQEECRPYIGPGNPQNNKVDLPQSGLAFWSRSGNIFHMDDSVVEPQGIPGWERVTKPFDYGCQNIYQGKIFVDSAHGHHFEMNDHETDPQLRSDKNRIKFETGCGHRFEMNDHTVAGGIAGEKRAITLQSTSDHLFEMVDGQNEQQVETRKGGNTPVAKAKKGYVRLRTGYGLSILLRDDNSQETTQSQFIEILAPQKDNTERGPHIFRMQEKATEEGLVFLRAGGTFVGIAVDDWVEQIGTEETSPAFKFTKVMGSYVIDTDEFYYNHSDTTLLMAEKFVIVGAGRDCFDPDGNAIPCFFPAIVARSPKVCPLTGFLHFAENSISDKVFLSASKSE